MQAKKKPGRRPEGLGKAFSCRLRLDQDQELRAEATKKNRTLVSVLREKLDELQSLKAG